METIIQQIMSEWLKKMMNYIDKNGINDIGKASRDILQMNHTLTNELLGVLVEELDHALVEAKSKRKEDGFRIKEREVERTVLLPTGEFKYKRTYFESEKDYAYLLDYLIGVEAYDRISKEVEKELIGLAADVSMQKSADCVTGGKVTRQSVKNKILNLAELAVVPERKDSDCRELHIFADEDHVNLQDGTNAIVPLITVSEGVRQVSKGRRELIHPIHFQGYAMKPQTQWEYVEAVIAKVYDLEAIEKIYIHADGASWIMASKAVFEDAQHVLDEFHLNKRMKLLCSGEVGRFYASRLYSALRKDEREKFKGYIQELKKDILLKENGVNAKKQIRAKEDHANYILRNWEAIQNRFSSEVGSCTEGLVSHILSERLSRSPMGWSKVGLSKMAMLRVYVKNGGTIETKDIGRNKRKAGEKREVAKRIQRYEMFVEERLNRVVKEAVDFSLFEHEDYSYAKITGTTMLLKSYARINAVS